MIFFICNIFAQILTYPMYKCLFSIRYFLVFLLIISAFSSCVDSKKIAYFSDVPDSTYVNSSAGLEPIIQKKDILSIIVSSLNPDASILFNVPNLPLTPTAPINNLSAQTAGYLVNDDGFIKFPILGDVAAAGLTQKQLSKYLAQELTNKKLLLDPIVNIRFLNFRVTVLGEVAHPGVIYSPSEQISILEAIGSAGDLTIYGLRDNVILIRQLGDQKLVIRLNLNSSNLLTSPYFFLKSNDILYIEPGKTKVAASDRTLQLLPIIFSGISVVVVALSLLLK
jgi:polysaccharide export outer membrane protein